VLTRWLLLTGFKYSANGPLVHVSRICFGEEGVESEDLFFQVLFVPAEDIHTSASLENIKLLS